MTEYHRPNNELVDAFCEHHRHTIVLTAIEVVQVIMIGGLFVLGPNALLYSFFISLFLSLFIKFADDNSSNAVGRVIISMPVMGVFMAIVEISAKFSTEPSSTHWKIYFKHLFGSRMFMIDGFNTSFSQDQTISVLHNFYWRPVFVTFDEKEYALMLLKHRS